MNSSQKFPGPSPRWRRLFTMPRSMVMRSARLAFGLSLLALPSLGLSGTTSAATASKASGTEIAFPFNQNSPRYWRFVSDRVMGGVSTGDLRFVEEDGLFFAHMKGAVSTANNGGFIQFRAGLQLASFLSDNQQLRGVRLMVRGDGQEYYVHFRTTQSRSPRDYYAASFSTSSEWQMIDLPFSIFKNRRTASTSAGGQTLSPDIITSMGIVAYGRDHIADIAVATIEFF